MTGLWRNQEDTPEGKYLVIRRDGSIPKWPWFVLGAKDPAAVVALYAYAAKAEELGMDPEYISDIRAMATEWQVVSEKIPGDPDAPPYRQDDPNTIEKMK